MSRWLSASLVLAMCAAACDAGPGRIQLPPLPAREVDAGPPVFKCKNESSHACSGGVRYTCRRHDEFLDVVQEDCGAKQQVCDDALGCVQCEPEQLRCKVCDPLQSTTDPSCNPDTIQKCDAQRIWQDGMVCDAAKFQTCSEGRCVRACDLAAQNRSYEGCDFYAVDLDNAAIDDMNNAAAQQYAVVVANPQRVPVSVTVEKNVAPYGSPVETAQVMHKLVPPGDIEVFPLPQREVDGSTPGGLNNGTNTAVTSNAYHVFSTLPITAYQFNPLENVNVFSNDAALLYPVSAIGNDYTVVSWPQTIGNSSDPDKDFDHTASNEDLRAFLTIVGTSEATQVHVKLGKKVVEVVGAGPIAKSHAGDVIDLQLGPFDVMNLETQGFNADFTGSVVQADKPVSVFVGSEASDVPIFGTYETRQCCADHLETQLLPDVSAGSHFIVARMPPRTRALADAALPGMPLGVAIVNEPEWIRLQPIASGETHVKTTLPKPDDVITLKSGADKILRADQDFMIDSDRPIAVLQALPSQGVTGIPRQYPGGDLSILVVAPVEQFRRDYIFLTPDKYAFDFVTIVAHEGAAVLLDGAPLPPTCVTMPIVADEKLAAKQLVKWVAHRCQLSFPEVTPGMNSKVLPGQQHDGVHTIVSTHEAGIVVYGFDRFVSYAYVGGLNLDVIN
ncbi:MAG TPA: IgGFc-binding protein [Polyangiales bacterium]|nr:IgGFc-binding protein [Polyangiales bacterium]